MNRRLALKQLAILTGGILLAPACSFNSEKASIALGNLKISAEQEKLLGEIVGTIIPTTETPGAKDLNIHHFVLVMIDDCREKSIQDDFVKGLRSFDDFIEDNFNESFLKSTPAQRQKMLEYIQSETLSAKNEAIDEEVKIFWSETRKLTIQGYMSSEYFLTEVFPYELVPGRFEGCLAISQAKTIE